MAGIKIEKKYRILETGGINELPYAGEIGTLVKIEENYYFIEFTEKQRKKQGDEDKTIAYFLGDFTEVDRYNTI